jgi:hypothetical protein
MNRVDQQGYADLSERQMDRQMDRPRHTDNPHQHTDTHSTNTHTHTHTLSLLITIGKISTQTTTSTYFDVSSRSGRDSPCRSPRSVASPETTRQSAHGAVPSPHRTPPLAVDATLMPSLALALALVLSLLFSCFVSGGLLLNARSMLGLIGKTNALATKTAPGLCKHHIERATVTFTTHGRLRPMQFAPHFVFAPTSSLTSALCTRRRRITTTTAETDATAKEEINVERQGGRHQQCERAIREHAAVVFPESLRSAAGACGPGCRPLQPGLGLLPRGAGTRPKAHCTSRARAWSRCHLCSHSEWCVVLYHSLTLSSSVALCVWACFRTTISPPLVLTATWWCCSACGA